MADPPWAAWLARFPNLPARNRYDLAWTRNRIAENIAALPATPPDRGDREALRRWLTRYAARIDLDQQNDVVLIDPLAVVGVFSVFIGVVAATIVPPLTIGTFAVSLGLLGKSAANNRDARLRADLVRQIRIQLQDLDERL